MCIDDNINGGYECMYIRYIDTYIKAMASQKMVRSQHLKEIQLIAQYALKEQ